MPSPASFERNNSSRSLCYSSSNKDTQTNIYFGKSLKPSFGFLKLSMHFLLPVSKEKPVWHFVHSKFEPYSAQLSILIRQMPYEG